MKSLFLLAVTVLASSSSFAANWDVQINTFGPIGNNREAGEVCGKVIGPADQMDQVRVHIVADPGTRNEGSYTTLPDTIGNFCHVIHTFYGRVNAEAIIGKTVVARRSFAQQ